MTNKKQILSYLFFNNTRIFCTFVSNVRKININFLFNSISNTSRINLNIIHFSSYPPA